MKYILCLLLVVSSAAAQEVTCVKEGNCSKTEIRSMIRDWPDLRSAIADDLAQKPLALKKLVKNILIERRSKITKVITQKNQELQDVDALINEED